MKISLINPNTRTKYPQPPLGLLSVGSVLCKLGHEVRLLDMNAAKIDILDMVRGSDVVGITATSLSYPEAVRVIKAIKEQYPLVKTMIGGVQASIAPVQVRDSGLFDAVIEGEGEGILDTVIDNINIRPNYIYKDGVGLNLDDLPKLHYELLKGYRYNASPPHGLHGSVMPVLTSRGCPYHCSFCSKAVFGSKYRKQSYQRIYKELEYLKFARNINEIAFYDDIFTLDKTKTNDLMLYMHDLQLKWTCQTRVNLVDADILKAMKFAGCTAIAYGLESGSPEILKGIMKDITLEQAEEAVRLTQQAGIKVIGYFMLGSPGETPETINATINWAIKLNPDYAQFSITTPLPGSELWEQRQFTNYAMGAMGNGLCELTGTELSRAVSTAYRRFYLRPRYILRQGKRSLLSWNEFKGSVKGLKMFIGGN